MLHEQLALQAHRHHGEFSRFALLRDPLTTRVAHDEPVHRSRVSAARILAAGDVPAAHSETDVCGEEVLAVGCHVTGQRVRAQTNTNFLASSALTPGAAAFAIWYPPYTTPPTTAAPPR